MPNPLTAQRLDAILELLDIPDSYYQLAVERYESIGRWLHRPASAVREFAPAVYSQGSFRYGTVIRPLFKDDEYDLDLVAELLLRTKAHGSQRDLKRLIGDEIKAYAEAKKFNDPPEEKKRCWRLDYADTVKFHMDILPAIPEDDWFKKHLAERHGVPVEMAILAIAITDIRHEKYDRDWPRSNPRGFGKWFELRMRRQAEYQFRSLLERGVYASIDDIPTWEWKTPLQRAIQILKRHRDVHFKDKPDVAPISMILTSLAAHAYEGEADLAAALFGILERMPHHVQPAGKRVPNPVNPEEDFADRWSSDSRLEPAFWAWHTQACADMRSVAKPLTKASLEAQVQRRFSLSLADEALDRLSDDVEMTSVTPKRIAAPAIVIASTPKPWGCR